MLNWMPVSSSRKVSAKKILTLLAENGKALIKKISLFRYRGYFLARSNHKKFVYSLIWRQGWLNEGYITEYHSRPNYYSENSSEHLLR